MTSLFSMFSTKKCSKSFASSLWLFTCLPAMAKRCRSALLYFVSSSWSFFLFRWPHKHNRLPIKKLKKLAGHYHHSYIPRDQRPTFLLRNRIRLDAIVLKLFFTFSNIYSYGKIRNILPTFSVAIIIGTSKHTAKLN